MKPLSAPHHLRDRISLLVSGVTLANGWQGVQGLTC